MCAETSGSSMESYQKRGSESKCSKSNAYIFQTWWFLFSKVHILKFRRSRTIGCIRNEFKGYIGLHKNNFIIIIEFLKNDKKGKSDFLFLTTNNMEIMFSFLVFK